MFSGEKLENAGEIMPSEMEVSLKSEKDFDDLEKMLEPLVGSEGAGQIVFVLCSMAEEDYVNHCKDATLEFGRKLATQFGGEESFFEIVPSANFFDARSYKPLSKVGYNKDYHSVALLEIKSPEKGNVSLVFDLTYSYISNKSQKKDGVLVLKSSGTRSQTMDMLNNHYGGAWKTELRFDKDEKHLVFIEEKSKTIYGD